MSGGRLAQRVCVAPDELLRSDRHLSRTAIAAGVIFVIAGLVKFVYHHWELEAFRSFGLPWPAALEIIAGVLETTGGVLLVVMLYLLARTVAPALRATRRRAIR